MPVADPEAAVESQAEVLGTALPFPPICKQDILNCSCHFWYPLYKSVTPKTRLIPLSKAFVDYLRADGIFLPPEDGVQQPVSSDWDSGAFDDGESDDCETPDPSQEWRETHEQVKSTIHELGGKVVPKLNWSAPKDATWMNATNSMECRTPNDIYSLLKASDFITHDLEHPFDGTTNTDVNGNQLEISNIPYHLVLRKQFLINPAVEFRCFVRQNHLLGVCQRDPNHFSFLSELQDSLLGTIQKFFNDKLRATFPSPNYAFDVYIPAPHNRVWLIDINPWAPRTDPLLFSWAELLTIPTPLPFSGIEDGGDEEHSVIMHKKAGEHSDEEDVTAESVVRLPFRTKQFTSAITDHIYPEFRLISSNDPQAYRFNTPQYSAHKLPKDVVDASSSGDLDALREFADRWKEIFPNQLKR